MEDIILIIGFFAAAVTTLAFLPQSIKTIKTRETKNLSLFGLIMFEIGLGAWLAYGILKADPPIIAANTISMVFVTITLVLKIKHG